MSITIPSPIDVLIVTPLDEERDAVLTCLRGLRPRQLPPALGESAVYYRAALPVTFSDGTVATYELVVTCIGEMGQPEAGAAVATAIVRWRPRAVLIVGIAGGIAVNGVALGDLLIANRIIGYEQAKARGGHLQHRWQTYDVDQGLLQRARTFADRRWHGPLVKLRPRPGRPTLHIGPVASGDKVIEDSALLTELLQTWPKLVGVEMEAVGGAAGGRQASPPPALAMVRAVSDLADPDKESPTVKGWRPYACAVAAAFAIAFLRSGPLPAASLPATRTGENAPSVCPAHSRLAVGVEAHAVALQRAVEARSAAGEVRAADLMRAVADDIPRAAALGTAVRGGVEAQLHAAVAATGDTAAAFATATRAIADEDARDTALALLGGFASLVEGFPRTLQPDRREELTIFLTHELFLTLIAALLRAGRWATLASLLDRHIFVANPPGGFGPSNVPITLLATPGQLLAARQVLHGRPAAPLRAVLLHERHGEAGPLAASAPLPGLVDADFLLWLRQGVEREREMARAVWRAHLLPWWADPPDLLRRAVERRTAEGLAEAVGIVGPGLSVDLSSLRQTLRRLLEAALGTGLPWLASALADLERIGTA